MRNAVFSEYVNLFINLINFNEIRLPQLRRIDAAKELFNAFATRTQAYKLHHEFGLTTFQSYAKERLALTKNVENFEVFIIYYE